MKKIIPFSLRTNSCSHLHILFRIGRTYSNALRWAFFAFCVLLFVNEIAHAITADPNPCTAPVCDPLCTTTIYWSQGDPVTQINVSVNGGPEALFSCAGGAGNYSSIAPWIACGSNYDFRHYTSTAQDCPHANAGTKGGLLGNVVVTRDPNVCSTDCVKFDFPPSNTNKKVLINKFGTGDAYPEPTYQTQARKIKVRATVKDSLGQPVNGEVIYFTVKDPADTAGYISNPHPNDNLDLSDPLSGKVNPQFAKSANGGIAETELTITGKYSGDNYQVEARFNSLTDPVQATSGTLTAWKRMYLEHDRMYKVGEFITKDSGPGSPNPINKVYVNNVGTFAAGNAVHVFSANNLTGQTGTVLSVDVTEKSLTLSFNLNSLYFSTVDPGVCDPNAGNFNAYCALYPYSFVAKTSGGTPTYDLLPTDTRYDRTISDPFVEIKVIPSNYLPAWPNINKNTIAGIANFIDERTFFYFENKNIKNHVQLVSAGSHQGISQGSNFLYGLSKSEGSPSVSNSSWVFWQKIKDNFVQYQNALDSVTAHELVHQWNVNKAYNLVGDCQQLAWLPLGTDPLCLMNTTRDRSKGVQLMHITDPSEIWCIRKHEDNLFVDPTVCP